MPIIFQAPLSSKNKSLHPGRVSKSIIKEAFCSTPIGTAVLTKFGLSYLAFISNGASSVHVDNYTIIIALEELCAAVLNFLGDSLTSIT